MPRSNRHRGRKTRPHNQRPLPSTNAVIDHEPAETSVSPHDLTQGNDANSLTDYFLALSAPSSEPAPQPQTVAEIQDMPDSPFASRNVRPLDYNAHMLALPDGSIRLDPAGAHELEGSRFFSALSATRPGDDAPRKEVQPPSPPPENDFALVGDKPRQAPAEPRHQTEQCDFSTHHPTNGENVSDSSSQALWTFEITADSANRVNVTVQEDTVQEPEPGLWQKASRWAASWWNTRPDTSQNDDLDEAQFSPSSKTPSIK